MLDISKLRSVRTIVTHENCADGMASAIILKDAFDTIKQEVDIQFVQYSTQKQAELPAQEGMLFCDITPTLARVEEFVAAGAIVLDHHKGAESVVKAFGELGVFADEVLEPGVSGALLAFREVWCPLVQPLYLYDPDHDYYHALAKYTEDFATVVGIRDTGQTKHAAWKSACGLTAVLRFHPPEKWLNWGVLRWFQMDHLVELGQDLYAKQFESTLKAIKEAYLTEIAGRKVAILFGVDLVTDAAVELWETVDLTMGFFYKVEDSKLRVVVSMRSRTLNCFAIAQAMGGNGHSRAAGFTIDVHKTSLNPYEMLVQTLERILQA